MKCPSCGIEVDEFPEDVRYEETLCNRCYDELEESEDYLMFVTLSETDKVGCPKGQWTEGVSGK